MAASRFVEVSDKEISEIKINSIPKRQKTCVKILKQLFALIIYKLKFLFTDCETISAVFLTFEHFYNVNRQLPC